MSYTITKESTGKVLVTSTDIPQYYLPSDGLVKQTATGIEVLNQEYQKIAGFAPADVTEVDDGATQTNPTTPTELFDALKTVFRNGGSAPTTTDLTGWGVYTDGQYTVGVPLTITGGAAYVNLPNNASSKIESQKPADIDTFYDGTTTKITGRNGDGVNLTISFSVTPTTNQPTRVTVVPDIGGAIGEIPDYAKDTVFTKGQNLEQRYLSSFNAFTLDTWEANGAQMKIKSDQNCKIYGVRYLITRTHKAI